MKSYEKAFRKFNEFVITKARRNQKDLDDLIVEYTMSIRKEL